MVVAWLVVSGVLLVMFRQLPFVEGTALEPAGKLVCNVAKVCLHPVRWYGVQKLGVGAWFYGPPWSELIVGGCAVAAWCVSAGLVRVGLRVVDFGRRVRGRERRFSPERRRVLGRAVAGVGAVGAGGVLVYGSTVEPAWLHVARHEVKIDGSPAGLRGLRLAVIADTHFGRAVPAARIERAVRTALAIEPDAVVLLGDYIESDKAEFIDASIALLKPLAAKPCFAVLGNHDHWAGADHVRQALREMGARLLDRDRVFLGAGGAVFDRYADGCVCLAGVGDLWEDWSEGEVEAALRGVPESCPAVLLSHNPDAAELPEMADPRIRLMLSGHTHGGQVRVPVMGTPMVPSRYGSKYAGGWCEGPRFPVIVSRGVGTSVLPVRFGARPEVVEVVLS